MRKLVYTAFIAFWAALGMMLAIDLLAPDGPPTREAGDSSIDDRAAAPIPLAEVALHDRLNDCWMAIEGTVYDVTGYIPRHPAVPEVIQPWCGTDATTGMRTKGRNSEHSARAWRMLARYRIGELAPD